MVSLYVLVTCAISVVVSVKMHTSAVLYLKLPDILLQQYRLAVYQLCYSNEEVNFLSPKMIRSSAF